MEFVNEFWPDFNRMQHPSLDFESDFTMPCFENGYDFNFDFDDLDVRIDDDCFKAALLNAVEDFDCHSLESSMSSDASLQSLSGSPSPPLSMEGSKTPYSDATQCRRPSNNGHIRRPMNPFMVFAKEERRRMSATTPNLHNAEISKICGRKWKDMSAEEKRPFELESARLKGLHEKEYPDYKYKPKKKAKSPLIKKRTLERNAAKHSAKKINEQPLKNSNADKSYLMVNGQKIPLKTAKSKDNKNAFNLQLKIDENYKIVPAHASPIVQILPPVNDFGSSLNNVQVKRENVNPVYFSFPSSPNDLSFSPLFVTGEADETDLSSNRVYVLINCPKTENVEETCL